MDAELMPSVFVGHGSPMNAIERNAATAHWAELGRSLPRPRAIVAISAHWYTRGTYLTGNAEPRTIHDFGGFPDPLYAMRYPAPGDPALAQRVAGLLSPVAAAVRDDWGLDHGTWSVLVHMYPAADVPVVQLSIDASEPASFHYALGQQLAVLRREGILVLGSGGIVHNLARVDWSGLGAPPDWALEFDEAVRQAAAAGTHEALVDYATLTAGARLAVPTPEHYLPLLYVLGTQAPGEHVECGSIGFELGSISTTSIVIGAR